METNILHMNDIQINNCNVQFNMHVYYYDISMFEYQSHKLLENAELIDSNRFMR